MKKTHQISDTQFIIGGVVFILLIIGVFYFAVIEDRYLVSEGGFAQNLVLSPDQPLRYSNEFCSSKLTDVAHEIHFIDKTILEEESFMQRYGDLIEDIESIIQIEQRDLEELREEFDAYKRQCDQFEEQPTSESCNTFLGDAKLRVDLARENVERANDSVVIAWLDMSFANLRKADRIYLRLQEICAGYTD